MADGGDLEPLTEVDCLRLLGTQALGRVGLSTHPTPVILPVIYRTAEDSIIFAAARNTTLSTVDGTTVAFEADGLDHDLGWGWSVVVVGSGQRRPLPSAGLWPQEAEPGEVIVIPIERISGRRLRMDLSSAPPPALDPGTFDGEPVAGRGGIATTLGAASSEPSRLGPTSDTLKERVEELSRQVATLQEALETRTAIANAVGILMASGNVSGEEAFDYLRRASQGANRKLRDIAAELVEGHEARIRGARGLGNISDG
ncbi:MAG TPA: ANTAR domain-containing protein [Acidimicrobiales bacterium]|nr:ANTAR domain-containing protein [Acidimicrobiales bacterium]